MKATHSMIKNTLGGIRIVNSFIKYSVNSKKKSFKMVDAKR